jgi:hypothetical protein
MDRSLTDLNIICEINRPQFSPIFLVKNEGVMGFPHQELLGDESLNQIEKPAPSLVPLVESEVELSVIHQ